MDRKEIKEKAKELIKGKKWQIWWPLLIISLVSSVLENLIGPKYSGLDNLKITSFEQLSQLNLPAPTPTQLILSLLVGIVIGIAGVAYNKYILKLVRGEEPEFNDIIETIKERWLSILLVELIVGVVVCVCAIFFVIPGIIMALAYAMTGYLVVDTDLEAMEVVKKSRAMMKGYKWNYFVFGLSFIGWILLVPFTLGILIIWLMPYVIVSMALYYENLKEING